MPQPRCSQLLCFRGHLGTCIQCACVHTMRNRVHENREEKSEGLPHTSHPDHLPEPSKRHAAVPNASDKKQPAAVVRRAAARASDLTLCWCSSTSTMLLMSSGLRPHCCSSSCPAALWSGAKRKACFASWLLSAKSTPVLQLRHSLKCSAFTCNHDEPVCSRSLCGVAISETRTAGGKTSRSV